MMTEGYGRERGGRAAEDHRQGSSTGRWDQEPSWYGRHPVSQVAHRVLIKIVRVARGKVGESSRPKGAHSPHQRTFER